MPDHSLDRRDPIERKLVMDTFGGGPVSAQVHSINGRSGRTRLGTGRSLRFVRPTTSPSLPQVNLSFMFFMQIRIQISFAFFF